MQNTPGKLILIAGLPGSGKSRWMECNTPLADFFVADDFMAHAFGDVGKFTYSRWYFPLVFALRAGRNAVISDIAFCDVERRREAEKVMLDAIDKLVYRWVFFTNEPELCRKNIERRAREEGRSLEKPLEALEQWKRRYSIPANADVVPVFHASS